MYFYKIKPIINDFKKILSFVEKKNKYKFFLLQIHIFFSSVLETFSIFTVIPLIDSLNNSSDTNTLTFLKQYIDPQYLNTFYLIILFCFFLITSNIYLILIKKKITDFGYALMLEIQKKVFQKIIHRKYNFFINKDLSYFNNVILHEVQRIKSGFIESSLFFISQILLIFFTFIGLMLYDYKITIFIVIILFTFYLLYLLIIGDKILKASKLNTDFKINTIQYLNDIFSVIKTIIFKKNKSKFYEKLQHFLSQNYKINAFEQVIGNIIKNLFEIYFLLIILIILLIGTKSIEISNILSYGIFLFAAYKIIPSFHKIYSHLISFLGSSNSLKIIVSELSNKNQYPENIDDKSKIKKIIFRDVSFSYNQRKKVLYNINYEMVENKIIGICGKSGSGKTTFIDLMSGLITPTSGIITINQNKDKLNNETLMAQASYCSQKTILIDDTLKNNICLETDNNNIDKKLLLEAIKIAELDSLIKNFDNGIETIIGQDGVRVSGGEAQRINIARTIYSNRNFIFLDECLNNLDMITSNKILNNLKNIKNKTIFFITHDLRLLLNFEEILVFNDGQLVEKNSFSNLKDNSKIFLDLLNEKND